MISREVRDKIIIYINTEQAIDKLLEAAYVADGSGKEHKRSRPGHTRRQAARKRKP